MAEERRRSKLNLAPQNGTLRARVRHGQVCATMLVVVVAMGTTMLAETGHEAWLRYAPIEDSAVRQRYAAMPAVVVSAGASPVVTTAREELIRGVRGMLDRTLRIEAKLPGESAIVIGTAADVAKVIPGFKLSSELKTDGYAITTAQKHWVVTGSNDRGVLYGVFALLRRIGLQQSLTPLDERQEPYAPLRWVNHWDNLDGTIERGYGGRSLFWENNNVREDLTAVREYARLLASVGINACSINNVNANPRVIEADFLPQVARIAEAMRPWGVHIAVSIDFSSPQRVGGLKTFDPLDAEVIAFWKKTIDQIYAVIPDLAGIVVKADSEGRLGPSAYGRTHADAANVIARPLKAHKGVIFYRGFVYDHRMDWNNLKLDRARAAWDNFVKLDGTFEDNVIIQIKHGPIDFQVREPASPLFGALEKSNQAIELQITPEYFGQSRHSVFLIPMWKEALDFDMQAKGPGTPVKALVAGKTFNRPTGGFVGVSNVGLNANWFNNHMLQANLYGYGRLAWNPNLTSQQISDEWTKLTFSHDPLVSKVVNHIQLTSWRTFENYTGPLGLQTLTDIVGNHFGVAVEASERNGWGQWHRADEKGVGMDRTEKTGTGYIAQYRAPVAKMYESLATCPDELVLFMHHVPYTHVLHSGKTVVQYLYDAHYTGAEAVAGWVREWQQLRNRVDEPRYKEILASLEYQAGNAELWRDAVNTWFWKTSGIADKAGRVGNWKGRFEAEKMQLAGYTSTDVKPWEAASGSQAIRCGGAKCTATLRYDGEPGWRMLRVRYFDQNDGKAKYRVFVGEQLVDEWTATDWFPTRRIDSSSSTRRTINGVALRRGDEIRIEGMPDGNEPAALDYVEILPVGTN